MRRATIFLVLTIVLLLSRVTHAKKQYTSQDTIRDKFIMLSGVTITRKLNPVKLSPDKISIRVSNKSRNTSGSVLDLLRKMPGVTILPNGSISLNGQEGVQILIDEKRNFLTAENLITFLASMPASSLETVELITQPNAVLDANGHGSMAIFRTHLMKPCICQSPKRRLSFLFITSWNKSSTAALMNSATKL